MGLRGGAVPLGAIARILLQEVLWLLGGALLAMPLLYYLHEQWQPAMALLAGFLGAVVSRRGTAALLARFPGFLRLNFELGVAVVGVILACWGTLALHPTAYWIFRWRQALALPVAAALLGLALAGMFVQQVRFEGLLRAHRDREDVLREETLRAELRALQAQINPHFLFNALNALAELTHSDGAAAEVLVQDLSHLLRYSLRSSSRDRVTLGQELAAVDRYLRVEGARLGERLRVERHVDAEVLELALPGLVLQPLVENAVHHAVAPRPEGGRIRIEARREGDRLLLAVADDGPGLPESQRRLLEDGLQNPERIGTEGAGGGLANAVQRVELFYRRRDIFSLRQEAAGGTVIELRLPLTPLGEKEEA